MKKVKLIMALGAVLVFSNLVFAGNPNNLATKMITKLSNDIALTDSQRVVIQAKANEFAVKMQNANSLTNADAKTTTKKQALSDYKTFLENVLTSDQKQQLMIKQNNRKQNATHSQKAQQPFDN